MFTLVKSHPKSLSLPTAFHGLITRWSPERTVQTLFRKCRPMEKLFSKIQTSKTSSTTDLQSAFYSDQMLI